MTNREVSRAEAARRGRAEEQGGGSPVAMSRPPHTDDEILGKAYDQRLMRRLWVMVRPHRRLIYLSLLLFPSIAGLELLQPWLVKIAIDRHILAGDRPGLTRVAAAYLACLLGLYALRVAVSFLTQTLGQRVMYGLRAALFAQLQRQDAT